MTKVSEKCPLDRDLLVRDDCFILDNGANGKIFVWKGERRLLQSPSRTSSRTQEAPHIVNSEEDSQVCHYMNDCRLFAEPPAGINRDGIWLVFDEVTRALMILAMH